ncbi:hypothetical protein [Leptospira interrogans]|uniref:hypothetical protein n=1 Tax=Leptospira interrogans TaxID=173 RepID=UPI0007746B1A|nr:hypothetical protein [Leptospira interrogans]
MKVHKLSNVTVFVETTVLKISKELSRKFFEVLGHAVTTRTHENNTKLLTAEFTKKIVILKKIPQIRDLLHFKAGSKYSNF